VEREREEPHHYLATIVSPNGDAWRLCQDSESREFLTYDLDWAISRYSDAQLDVVTTRHRAEAVLPSDGQSIDSTEEALCSGLGRSRGTCLEFTMNRGPGVQSNNVPTWQISFNWLLALRWPRPFRPYLAAHVHSILEISTAITLFSIPALLEEGRDILFLSAHGNVCERSFSTGSCVKRMLFW